MSEPLSSLIRPDHGPSLPALDRFAPPPPLNLVVAEIESRSNPGDVVVDLHGRGGWIARAAVSRLRRAYAHESTALTRLVAEVVLRPPDLRHFDAAVNALGAQPRGEVGLRQALNELFASQCSTCGRSVVVDEFVWDGEADAPFRKIYRCVVCRDQVGGPESRSVPTDVADADRARALSTDGAARSALAERFPVLPAHQGLTDEILDLWTARALTAIEGILARIEQDLRAAPIEAALRLALLHALLPTSRLSSYPGRVAALRIVGGHVRAPGDRQWRERNPWLAFEDGCRVVRGFIQRLEAAAGGPISARLGDDPALLADGSINVVLRRGHADRGFADTASPFADSATPLPLRGPAPRPSASRARVRLVLSQPPVRWSTESLSFAFVTTAITLGRDAAAALPLEPLIGQPPGPEWGSHAAALRRSLTSVTNILAPDARVVVLLEPGGPEGLVAGALGGVEAGYRLTSAMLAEEGDAIGGTLEFVPPGGATPGRPRTRGNVPLDALPPEPEPAIFRLADVEQAVTEIAVEVLRARGEPARSERLLGEVLVGLDRTGDLRRLTGTRTFSESEARGERALDALGYMAAGSYLLGGSDIEQPEVDGIELQPPAVEPAGAELTEATTPTEEGAKGSSSEPSSTSGRRRADRASGEGHRPSDHVSMLLELIEGELRRPDQGRLEEIDGRWWLKDERDIAAAALPLSDRVEWAVFSLLSTAGGLTEAAFFDRVATMFRGHDTPDEALVRACLDSYRSRASTPDLLRTNDELQARHLDHTELIGQLVEYGHRLGLRCWVSKSEQKRVYNGLPLIAQLSDVEQRAYLPLISRGPLEALEQTDVIWYLRNKATFLIEVEWTAMLGEPLLKRGARIQDEPTLVRFLVVLPERVELVRFKLERSPLLRRALERGNWHILKADHLRALVAQEGADLDRMAPYLGLDPEVERGGEQLPLFE
ncbi:MAG TPA: hypothetical protein VIF44_04340 [Candidatus Limnocylindrales bacterium]